MIATNLLHQVYQWLPAWGQGSQSALEPSAIGAVRQLLLQPGDFYFLEAGSYQVHVLVGELWIPEQGVLAAGEQVQLLPNRTGLSLRTTADRPAVFLVRAE